MDILDNMAGVSAAVRAATLGSFTAAAQAADVSVASVSKTIAALEARLGVRLFQRAGRRAVLTAEGQVFVRHARAGIECLAEAAQAVAPTPGIAGVVRITTAPGFGKRYLMPLLPGLAERHPGLVLHVVLTDRNVDLVAEGFDVGVRGGSAPPEGMVARRICEIEPVLVAAPRYLRRHGRPQRPEDLAEHRLVRLRLNSGREPGWAFRGGAELRAPPALVVSDPEAALGAVLAGFGIAHLSRHHAHDALQRGQLEEVLPGSLAAGVGSLAVFYPHRKGLAPRVRALVDYLIECWAAEPGLQPRAAAA